MNNRHLPIISILLGATLCHGQGIITTVVGGAGCCATPDGVQATTIYLPSAEGITVDSQGNLYIWDAGQEKIKKVNTAGIISTVAGSGSIGYTGDGGPATSASLFAGPVGTGIAVDAAGNIYFSDGYNHVIRKVNTAGIISTYAGTGAPGFSGDGGQATKAQLYYPAGIVLDSAGNLYIADSQNNRIRKVDANGTITTVAGNGFSVNSTDGGQALSTPIDTPEAVAIDSAGNLYISETSQSRVRKVSANGIVTTYAGQLKKTNGFSGDGGLATAATLAGPLGLTLDAAGSLYIADNSNGRVRKVDAAGIISTYAGITGNASSPVGDGGPATGAYLGVPRGVALDSSGRLYISCSATGGYRVRRVAAAAGLSATPTSLSFAYTIGGSTPASQTVSIANTASASGFTATASTTSGGNWLSVTPTSGATTPATLTVSVNPAGIPGGTYQGAITVTPTTTGISAATFPVTLTVTGAGAPTILSGGVVNALGYQTTLAPDTVFVIFGSAMGPAALVSASASPSYPATLGGTSITFTPAAGGNPISAGMVYSYAGQVAGILPSSITPGSYNVRVTYNSLTSAPQAVTVVARSFGIATANSAGTGTVQATIGNINGGVSLTRFTTGSTAFSGLTWTLTPAHPDDTLVLWGTGGGADPANDTGGTSGDQTQAGNFSVLVGGRSITPIYAGASSGYPGLWQVNFTLPSDIAPDCFASLQVSAGGNLSNTAALPIAPSGQTYCADPSLNATALAALDAGGTVTLAGLSVAKESSTQTLTTSASGTPSVTTTNQEVLSGAFISYTAAEYAAVFEGLKIGPCTISDITATSANYPGTPQGYLDAGTSLPASGPGLANGFTVPKFATATGPIYDVTLNNGTISGGTYTLSGSGGKDVGAFTASVAFPSSFTVANWDTLNTIDRSQPLTVSWTGSGFSQVILIGTTYSVVGKDATNANILHTVSFTCQVPAAPGSYTIPTSVLSHLLPESIVGNGSGYAGLTVEATNPQSFAASLTAGGQVAIAAFSSVQSYSRNLSVQ